MNRPVSTSSLRWKSPLSGAQTVTIDSDVYPPKLSLPARSADRFVLPLAQRAISPQTESGNREGDEADQVGQHQPMFVSEDEQVGALEALVYPEPHEPQQHQDRSTPALTEPRPPAADDHGCPDQAGEGKGREHRPEDTRGPAQGWSAGA